MMMFVLISPFFMVRSIQNTIVVGQWRTGHWQFSTGSIESGQSQKQQQ